MWRWLLLVMAVRGGDAEVVLRAVFPGAKVVADGGRWRVRAKTVGEAELCASEDIVVGGKFSEVRLVELRVFRWPGEKDGLLGVLQYKFLGASPAMACPSIGRLAHVRRMGGEWRVTEEYLFEMVHHSGLPLIEMRDLDGDGVAELLVASDWGGAGTWGNNLHIFELGRGRFDEVLSVTGEVVYMTDDDYSQRFDAVRGREFCFVKTARVEDGKRFAPPRVTRPCYGRGTGVDVAESELRRGM